jgi:ribulose bisphosphate carboxylase small subunit
MNEAKDALPVPGKYDFSEIKNLLQVYFMRDWAVSIEYAVTNPQGGTEWKRWDKPLFALSEVDPVIDRIMTCCKANPDCSMKMTCEHFNPGYRFIYFLQRQDAANDGAMSAV